MCWRTQTQTEMELREQQAWGGAPLYGKEGVVWSVEIAVGTQLRALSVPFLGSLSPRVLRVDLQQ